MTVAEPFEIRVPDAALADLQRRLAATRWAADAYEDSWAFGTPRAFAGELCERWQRFDWRALEARLNRFDQVRLELEGLRLHSLHHRSARADAMPLLLLHGWPGSFLDFSRLWEPLAAPAPGEPAFHVVCPSLPGYGFSTTRPGINAQRIAGLLVQVMAALGYKRFLVQGGNWGSLIGTEIARQFPDRVIGLHLSSVSGSPPSAEENPTISEEERSWLSDHASFPHFAQLSQAPLSPAHALNDSPAGLVAWLGEKLYDWADNRAGAPAISPETMLATIALYWFTGSIGTSMALYRELILNPPVEKFVDLPTAVSVFPYSVAKLPRSWAERHYTVVQWRVHERGGHFPALEVPELLLEDMRRFAAALG